MSQTNEEIVQAIDTTGKAFDDAVKNAVAALEKIGGALKPYRNQLPQGLRAIVDAITAMQGGGVQR